MESLKIFAILLLVALPLVSAAGGGDSRKRKEVGESSSQRPAKSTRQAEAQPEAPSPYPGSEFLQTPQLEYDMPPGYDTDFTQLRHGFAPQSPVLAGQMGGSSVYPMSVPPTPLDHPGASSFPVDPTGAGSSSQQPPIVQSADMSSEELFHHWLENYHAIFKSDAAQIEPEQFKSLLTQLKSFEQTAQFHELYKQAEKSARPQQEEKANLWDYVKDAKVLMQQRLTLARKFKTLADILLQLFNWGQNSCIPNDVAKLAQIQEKLVHYESVKKILDYIKLNQQQDCDSRYREVILNGEILLGQDTKEAARRMLELTAKETIQQMMTNKNDPQLLKKIVEIMSLYLAQLDTAKFENFGVIEIDNPKIEYPRMLENEIINPCARICELNQIPYNYYVEYKAVADSQSSSGKTPINEDLAAMIQKIEFCCFIHNKKPPADEVKVLYENMKNEILKQQEAGGSGTQPATQTGQAGQPARLQVTLPSELMGSEAARVTARGTAPGPDKQFTRPLSGVVIREPGEAQQQRQPSDAGTSGTGKGVISEERIQHIYGRALEQPDELDPQLQAELLSRYEPHLDPYHQFISPVARHPGDIQNFENLDPEVQAALLVAFQHQDQSTAQQQQHQQAFVDPNQFAAHLPIQHQQLHPELHQQLHPGLHQQLHPELHQQLHPGLHQQLHPELHQQLHPELHQQLHPELHQQLHPELQHQQFHPEMHHQMYPHDQYDPHLLAALQATEYEQQMLAQYQHQLQAQRQSQPPAQAPGQPQAPQVQAPAHHPAQDPQQPHPSDRVDVSDSE